MHVIGGAEYTDAFGALKTTTFSMFNGGPFGLNENRVLVNTSDGNTAT